MGRSRFKFDLDPSTLNKQPFGAHYPGPGGSSKFNGMPDFSVSPVDLSGYPAIGHDRRYFKIGAEGVSLGTNGIRKRV